ncbi:GNAT family N-acetyltransferase [Microbacterium esteraromaticum]|uniref:GNAT family N-acetyltransferase n=1 Tax=Microbacterium esteraromaticum TaxID=57043 RepID=A0A7D7WH82_9MICO|nr:GNAT family N-acetyltransferase [Microbacterium esteraromaticum]QMU98051.1 GNAT family N-acetyltransferase [Microbacterium esteraromaticum]
MSTTLTTAVSTSTGLEISALSVPETLDAPEAADFHAFVALNNAICLSDTGLDDFARSAEEMLPHWRESTDEVHLTLLAREAGAIVGAVTVSHATAEPTSAEFDLMVLPENWGRGIETALLAAAEAEVRALGRRVIQAWTLHRPDPDADTFVPKTGWGRATRTPHAQLLADDGFVLEQVERNSAFDLQADPSPIERMLADALAVAGDDYRLVEWTIPTPPALRSGYAWALSRMSTDAPSGDLEVDEEIWDADRIARRDARFVDGGQTVSVAAVEHVPTGTLAAFNELVIGADPTGVTHQYCTLVLKEHRGHRLGQIVKCANILRWRGIAPQSPRITTFNAEENRPMLDINEAMGFRPASYAGAWQKKLS